MPVVGRLGPDPRPAGQDAQSQGRHRHDGRRQGRRGGEGRQGRVPDRPHAIVHLVIGKTGFDERALLENYAAVIEELIRAKPSAAKGRYIRSITLAIHHGSRHQGRPTVPATSSRSCRGLTDRDSERPARDLRPAQARSTAAGARSRFDARIVRASSRRP